MELEEETMELEEEPIIEEQKKIEKNSVSRRKPTKIKAQTQEQLRKNFSYKIFQDILKDADDAKSRAKLAKLWAKENFKLFPFAPTLGQIFKILWVKDNPKQNNKNLLVTLKKGLKNREKLFLISLSRELKKKY